MHCSCKPFWDYLVSGSPLSNRLGLISPVQISMLLVLISIRVKNLKRSNIFNLRSQNGRIIECLYLCLFIEHYWSFINYCCVRESLWLTVATSSQSHQQHQSTATGQESARALARLAQMLIFHNTLSRLGIFRSHVKVDLYFVNY